MESKDWFEAIECKKKWASLRNAFSRDLRIENIAKQQKRLKKTWYLADHLSFLKDHLYKKIKPLKSDNKSQESIDKDTNHFMFEENTNYFDSSTQEAINEYLTTEELEELENTNQYFKSVNFNSAKSTVSDSGSAFSSSTAKRPQDLQVSHESSLKSKSHLNGNMLTLLNEQQQQNPDDKRGLQISKPRKVPVKQNEETEFISTKGIGSNDKDQLNSLLDDRNMIFFKSIIPDILRLSDRKQRLYKQNVMIKLNKLLDEL